PLVALPDPEFRDFKWLGLDRRILPQRGCHSKQNPMTWPLRSTAITAASSLLRTTPPLRLASVLSASWCSPLGFLPLHRSNRFPRSVPKPVIPSRRLYTGCRMASVRFPPCSSRAFAEATVSTPSICFRCLISDSLSFVSVQLT